MPVGAADEVCSACRLYGYPANGAVQESSESTGHGWSRLTFYIDPIIKDIVSPSQHAATDAENEQEDNFDPEAIPASDASSVVSEWLLLASILELDDTQESNRITINRLIESVDSECNIPVQPDTEDQEVEYESSGAAGSSRDEIREIAEV